MSATKLPTSSIEAEGLLKQWLSIWDQGGKDQLYEILQIAFTQSQQDGDDISSQDSFSLLLLAWITRQILHDQIQPSSFSDVLLQIAPPIGIENGDTEDSAEAGPSRSHSPESDAAPNEKSSPISELLLDAIWTADLQIDARREIAATHDSNAIIDDALDGETLDEQSSRSRSRLADIVCELVEQQLLKRLDVAERLELPLLHQIGLVPDERDMSRKAIRINTARLYKQQKFNLLREENEGFSGLINELLLGIGPPTIAISQAKDDGSSFLRVIEQESVEVRNERAQRVMNNISALIGYFDMDPSRVLDVILDIFSANVYHHWPFFLALLSLSPWRTVQHGTKSNAMDLDADEGENAWRFGSVNTNISGESGHHTCAQILGFKFSFYQHPETTRQNGLEELYTVAAILIRVGQIRFVDLMPHLSPDEKGMTKLHEEYKTALSDRAMSAKGNALSMAAPLTADEGEGGALSDARDANGQKDANAVPHVMPNQVLGLLKALLAIGEIRHAFLILGKYPWLCGAFPEVSDLLCRLLNVMIEPIYSSVALSKQIDASLGYLTVPQRYRFDNKKQELIPLPFPRADVTSLAPEPLGTHLTDFVYFFPEWKEKLPRCTDEQFLSEFVPYLRMLGPYLSRNLTLFQRICRIGKVAMRSIEDSSKEKTAWLELIRNVLLPALSMTSGNSGLVSEVWVILRQLSYTERFSVYGEWKYSLYKRPELRVRQAEVEKEAKGILKRISSDNVKLSGRALAKASHANPTIFFTVALNQVQSYSNLIAPIVECAKYLTHFEYDVFGFNLIDALSNPEKDRTKQDGTSVSQWLQSLAAFTGTLYWRYAMMDCSPVLQYIANQLKENNIKDLVIIRELILKMAGIEPLQNLSDSQVAALTGGRMLRMEAMMIANAGIATKTRLALRKSSSRLLHALKQSMMIMPLLILIAQQRQACIHLVPDSEAHLKYLGNLFDTCQEILFQYIEFMHNQLDSQAYSDLIPTMDDLCRRFELEPAIASHLVRPRMTLQIRQAQAKENEERLRKELLSSQNKKSTPTEETEKAEEGDNTEKKEDDANMTNGEEEKKPTEAKSDKENSEDTEMQENDEVKPEVSAEQESEEADKPIWNPALSEAYEAAENVLPDDAKEVIGVHFFSTFWQLALSDISVPAERYQQEIRTLQKVIDENPEGSRSSNPKVRAQAQDSIRLLRVELKEQTAGHQFTKNRLKVEKSHWFKKDTNRADILYAALQYCFIPRALLSPTDAVFAARFIRIMHTNATYNFDTVKMYDKIFMEQIPALIFSTTENEARNLARFLQVIMTDLTAWFKDEKKFVSEAKGENLPGFQIRWGERHGDEEVPDEDMMQFDQFKSIIRKWHNMLQSTFIECLTSREYMRIRNCIVVMTRIASFFPIWELHGSVLVETISKVSNEEERGDLKVLGQGLLATLRKEQKGWIPMPKKKAAEQSVGKTDEKSKSTDKTVDTKPAADSSTKANGESLAEQKDSGTTAKADKDQRPAPQSRSTSTHKLPARPGLEPKASSNAPSPRPSWDDRTTSTTKAAGSDDAKSVQAARQAALASMREGAMNPPKAPTRDRERDRASAVQRGNNSSSTSNPTTANSSARSRNDGDKTPRSQSARSRDTSPRASDRGATANRTNADSRSRAPSEDVNGGNRRDRNSSDYYSAPKDAPNRRDRGWDDRYDSRQADRTRDRDSRTPRDARDSDRDRERDRERAKKDSINQVRGGDDRRDRRDTDRDRTSTPSANTDRRNGAYDRRDSAANANDRTKSQSSRDSDRGYSARNDSSRQPVSSSRTSSIPQSDDKRGDDRRDRDRDVRGKDQDARSSQQSKPESASSDRNESTPKATPSSMAEPSSTASPSGSKKRSLFDRLTMEQNASNSAPASPGGNGEGSANRSSPKTNDSGNTRSDADTRRDTDQQPNKRARTSKAGDDDRRHISSSNDRGSEADKGISIHGQGRATPNNNNNYQNASRSASQPYARGGGGQGGYRAGEDAYRPNTDQTRSASSGNLRRDRQPNSRDRDRRRRERRSGA
ncbi:uncharacterized protein FA14DRAFT_172477 [Meira miltonrushii]|uniref:THO complex subunit 2 n=1 Tax=Meira miltonrushii TaxID=1280837 RepID=A0A316VE13_9BASI|nr:uncharacterized protein FA14DRAFT_172477 [Meira miltonrushii]PWN35879.1 hypothetical protein FA14DRAFT_172477 [Meira miltonrushii]